jgi:hypothetical protein
MRWSEFAIVEGKSRRIPRRLPVRLRLRAPKERRDKYAALKLEGVRQKWLAARWLNTLDEEILAWWRSTGVVSSISTVIS